MLRRWRTMQEFRAITLQHAIGIMNAQLMFIDEQPVGRWIAFKQGNRPFDSENATDERAGQQRNDAEMGDEKGNVMLAPRPARESGDSQISAEQDEPEIEPGRAINISARDFGIEARFPNRAGNGGNDQDREQNNCQLERGEKFKDRATLPGGTRRGNSRHDRASSFHKKGARFNSRIAVIPSESRGIPMRKL